MIPILIYLILFVIVYIIDLATALLHRKVRPNNFKRTEANERFRRCVEDRGVLKGIGVYMILSLTESIILFVAVGVAAWWIFDSTILNGLSFTFLLLAMVHVLGTLTNLIALFKKDEVVVKKPLININNLKAMRNNESAVVKLASHQSSSYPKAKIPNLPSNVILVPSPKNEHKQL